MSRACSPGVKRGQNVNHFPGSKGGKSPVVPFFKGGEGDGTFNGFASLLHPENSIEIFITGCFE